MSTTLILLIAGIVVYIGVVAFALALLAIARRADEQAERHALVLATRRERFRRHDDQRAARGVRGR